MFVLKVLTLIYHVYGHIHTYYMYSFAGLDLYI